MPDPTDPIGKITPPSWWTLPGIDPITGQLIGPIGLLNSFLKLIFIVAGLWAFLNLILAGFGFISAGGDPKNVTKAWDKIWQTLVGLLIIVASFLLAAIFGMLLFKDPTAILQPKF
jgi:hypothetical protein